MRSVGSCVRPGRRATKGHPPNIPQIQRGSGLRVSCFFSPPVCLQANYGQPQPNKGKQQPNQAAANQGNQGLRGFWFLYSAPPLPYLPCLPLSLLPLRLCRQGEVADFAVLVRSGRLRQLRCLGAKAEEDKLQADGLGGSITEEVVDFLHRRHNSRRNEAQDSSWNGSMMVLLLP